MFVEKKIRRHTAKDEQPEDDNQRVAGCLCNARKIDHLVFSEIANLFRSSRLRCNWLATVVLRNLMPGVKWCGRPEGAGTSVRLARPLQKAQPVQDSAGRRDSKRIEPRPEHQCHCSSSDRCTLPPESGRTSDNIAAGNASPIAGEQDHAAQCAAMAYHGRNLRTRGRSPSPLRRRNREHPAEPSGTRQN